MNPFQLSKLTNIFLFEFTGQVTLNEGGLAGTAITDYRTNCAY